MRESLLDLLRCPRCHAVAAFALDAHVRTAVEIREGSLQCRECGLDRSIEDGIVDLLYDPPDFVVREAAGLERFATEMRADGWDRERIRQLPNVHLGYWVEQERAMRYVLTTVPFRRGDRLLDVGANTCWASNIFARKGLEVVALDIATTELQGLRTADYFLDDGEVYFERVLSAMFAPAFSDASFDYVFCCQTMHHNDPENLLRTMREMHRILRPGGRLLMVNEPLRFPLRPKRRHAEDVACYEGNEHVYFLHEYRRAARQAGFRVALPGIRAAGYGLKPGSGPVPPPRGRLAPLKAVLRSNSLGRRLVHAYRIGYYWWKHAIAGDASLSLFAEKTGVPGRS
jgi:SAM-dependent methyltransferase